jgi:hypothetical protein
MKKSSTLKWREGIQKIAACGSSDTDVHFPVGAAAGCDPFSPLDVNVNLPLA